MSRRIFASSSTTRMRRNITPGRAQDGSTLGTRPHQSRRRGRAAFSRIVVDGGVKQRIGNPTEVTNDHSWTRVYHPFSSPFVTFSVEVAKPIPALELN